MKIYFAAHATTKDNEARDSLEPNTDSGYD